MTRLQKHGPPLALPTRHESILYYSRSSEKPRIAGELRLRVTSNDAASFESGSDLLRTDGRVWSRPLYSISKHYPSLYEKLREDRLIPEDLDIVLSTLPSRGQSCIRSHFFYTLNDTFIVDFSSSWKSFFVITEQGLKVTNHSHWACLFHTAVNNSALDLSKN